MTSTLINHRIIQILILLRFRFRLLALDIFSGNMGHCTRTGPASPIDGTKHQAAQKCSATTRRLKSIPGKVHFEPGTVLQQFLVVQVNSLELECLRPLQVSHRLCQKLLPCGGNARNFVFHHIAKHQRLGQINDPKLLIGKLFQAFQIQDLLLSLRQHPQRRKALHDIIWR